MAPPPLASLRVLDLSGPEAELAGRTLAELGAQVLKIEPPGGSASRGRSPFSDANGSSLYWATVGLGKASLVLDLDVEDDRGRLRELVAAADVLVESYPPGHLDSLGLGPGENLAANPGLIHVSVTPYGSNGPKAGWPGTELTLEAAGGRMDGQGDRDRPPVPVGYPQAYFHAGVQAAADVLVALYQRQSTGRGQYLDVSIQAVMVHTLFGYVSGTLLEESSTSSPESARPSTGNSGADNIERRVARLELLPDVWECADGFAAAPLAAGALPLVAHVMAELEAEGSLDPRLVGVDWLHLAADVLRERSDDEVVRLALDRLGKWFKARKKVDLYELAHQGDFRLGPLMTTADLLADRHLEARRFWSSIGSVTHPGPAVRPWLWSITPAPAPTLGQGSELADGWFRSPAAPASDGRSAVAARSKGPTAALAGLKVADLSWVAVGPTMGRYLADHGASVVRVESSRRLDVARTLGPFKGPDKGINDSHWYAHFNASKLGLSLNLATPEGRGVARRLILEWADVVLESFSPGTMARLGLDYGSLAAHRPDLVMMSASLLGQEGPMASYAGFGQQGVGLAGISTVTGWPDRKPVTLGAYTDVVAPKYGLSALLALAALLHRRATGEGSHLDLAQVEASIRFIEPLVLDQTVNGRTARRRGLDSDDACPHGVYPVRGHRRYVAVAVETPQQWAALLSVTGLVELERPELGSLAGRLSAREEIDAALGFWLSEREGDRVVGELCTAGVPAATVARQREVARDPQLWHRGFFVPLEHRKMGRCHYEAQPTLFADSSTAPRAAPCLGQDTEMVLTDLLGYLPAEIEELRRAGALD